MAKFCVFCGKPPTDKNKEHVVPRWLIGLTGDHKRNIFVGFKKDLKNGFEDRTFAFDQLVFPACEACNSKYSALEISAKSIVEKLLAEEALTGTEISKLLDWLDKVRIGLWLGFNQLDKNYADVDPHFHIDSRIGQYDRLLFVEKSNFDHSRLNFGGVDTFSFALTPSAFVLVINNFYLTNVSYMFLLSRRLGFPYPSSISMDADSHQMKCDFSQGLERVMKPILRKPILERGILIYQPMFAGGLFQDDPNALYDTEYVRQHSLDHDAGVGSLFIEKENAIIELHGNEKIKIRPQPVHKDDEHFVRSIINILEWQNWLDDQLPSQDELTIDQKKYIRARLRTAKAVNHILIKHHKRILAKRKNEQRA